MGALARPIARVGGLGPHANGTSGNTSRLAQEDLDPLGPLELDAATGEQVVQIMRLDPIAEEFHRNGNLDDLAVKGVELERVEPACEDVVAETSPQRRADFRTTAIGTAGRNGTAGVGFGSCLRGPDIVAVGCARAHRQLRNR
jgi:hypothetical protein